METAEVREVKIQNEKRRREEQAKLKGFIKKKNLEMKEESCQVRNAWEKVTIKMQKFLSDSKNDLDNIDCGRAVISRMKKYCKDIKLVIMKRILSLVQDMYEFLSDFFPAAVKSFDHIYKTNIANWLQVPWLEGKQLHFNSPRVFQTQFCFLFVADTVFRHRDVFTNNLSDYSVYTATDCIVTLAQNGKKKTGKWGDSTLFTKAGLSSPPWRKSTEFAVWEKDIEEHVLSVLEKADYKLANLQKETQTKIREFQEAKGSKIFTFPKYVYENVKFYKAPQTQSYNIH
jgi:hypothetical protein